jgi:hypothetical protein
MGKYASVYKRNNSFDFRTFSETSVGVLICSGEPISCDINTPTNELGSSIIKILSESRNNVPHPKDAAEWKALNDSYLKIFNAKSISAAMKGVLTCSIREEGEFITFRPFRNMGAKNGFVPIQEKEIKIPSDSCMEEIGNTLLKAFLSCE